MTNWKTVSSKEVYSNPWIRVREDAVLDHLGKPLTYGIVELIRNSVFIVAKNSNGQICLIKNYRYSLNKIQWEIPAGFLDEGENSLTGAKRELLEETGLVSNEWYELGTLYQAGGVGKIPYTVFLAKNVQPSTARLAAEDISEQTFFSHADID